MTELPFTRAEFFEVFAAYNEGTWPVAILAYLVAWIAVRHAWKGGPSAGRRVAAILASMWAWVGLVYHGVYFREINPAAIVFAAGFALQAVLFGWAAVTRQFTFGKTSPVAIAVGVLLMAYATLVYPLIGLLLGEGYPAAPLFGVAPCPLLIFTFGMFILARTVCWWLWIVPLLWSGIGGSAAYLLAVPQDLALPVSAISALLLVRKSSIEAR